MLSTVFRKQLAALLGVLLISFALLTLVLNSLLKDFLVDRKEELLFREGEQLVELLKEDPGANGAAKGAFLKAEARLKKTQNIRVDLLAADEGTPKLQWRREVLKLLRQSEIQDISVLQRVLRGERVVHKGRFTLSDEQILLSVGLPLRENGKVIGALFLSTPVEELQTTRVTRLIFLTALLLALPAAALIYVMSRRMTGPLRRMNEGARQLGQGDFSVRIPADGRDEVSQLAATFNTMASQLEQLDRMRKELVQNVSHELRTPLTSVRGFIQGLAEGVIPEEQRPRYLKIAHAELERLTVLLNTMLDLSAIETGTVTLERQSIRWSSLVETVLDTVIPRMEEKGISCRIGEPEDEILKAYGDPERLKQVLFNLLDNAIRHTERGGTITVRSSRQEDRLTVQVADTGSGIPPEQLERIWERFYTEDASRGSRRERSGLGLTITKQLIERMDGTITVASQPGSGTVFTVTLPMPPKAG
ncbi:sensor histidine kinase [Gorillibacterium sp. sgz5001074]|uniref:sensor histidine kinase n=1 Tax=Gorillibacterium sp. sgz5001074 TaxID=3446695 RepID=UPI003F66CAB4